MVNEAMKDYGGRRSGTERRKYPFSHHTSEKRSGKDRRSGIDRRSGMDRRRDIDRRRR